MEIAEGKLKEIFTEQKNDFSHIVGIFKEDLESKIQIIGEQFGSMMEDIQIIKTDVQFLKGALKKRSITTSSTLSPNMYRCLNPGAKNSFL